MEMGYDCAFGHETGEGAAKIGFGKIAKERSLGCLGLCEGEWLTWVSTELKLTGVSNV